MTTTRRRKPVDLLVGPMRPLVAGGEYDAAFHTFERLAPAGLGVSYAHPHRVVLVPMAYAGVRKPRARRRG